MDRKCHGQRAHVYVYPGPLNQYRAVESAVLGPDSNPAWPCSIFIVRVLQGNAEIYCEELTHTMMEAEKSYRRLEARKASGVVPVLSPKA